MQSFSLNSRKHTGFEQASHTTGHRVLVAFFELQGVWKDPCYWGQSSRYKAENIGERCL